MDNTQNTYQDSLESIVKRTAFPFFFFALVLTGLLALSWYLIVPQLTHIEVNGTVRDIDELQAYTSDLNAQILTLEDERKTFLLPVNNALYERLKTLKESRSGFQALRSNLNRIMKTMFPDRSDVFAIADFSFDAEGNSARLRGEIHNVGPRSMTVLAQFVEAIQALPFVTEVQTDGYTRQESDAYGFYSPFTLHIQLQ